MRRLLPYFFVFFILSGCRSDAKEVVTQTETMLDTVVQLTVYHQEEDQATLASQAAFDLIEDLNSQLSMFEEDSEINAVNEAAGQSPQPVSPETYEVVERGLAFGQETGGSFNIAIGALSSVWVEAFDKKEPPRQVNSSLVDLEAVQLSDGEIYLEKPGMKLDLGGIAKGYMADRVAELLREHDIDHAIINLGGNVLVMGSAPESGRDWNVGVQNPFEVSGDIVGQIQVSDASVVTSGIYQRYFEHEGNFYHHLLNPETGYPIDNELAAVTIVSPDSTTADALSTAVFVMGLEDGYAFIEGREDAEAVFVSRNQSVYVTSGLDSFELTHEDYEVAEIGEH